MNTDHADAYTQRALILIGQNRFADADALLRQALADDPEDGFALYLLALCQVNIPEKKDLALETINRALSLDSMNPAFFALRSSVYHEFDKHKEALADADTAIAIDPENEYGHSARGRALLGMEKWNEAEKAFCEALRIDPDNQNAGNLLALALRHQNRSNETTQQINSLLSKNPNDSFSQANAGWVALERHDLKQAEFHFLEALRIDPTSEYARRGILETFKAKSPPYRLYLAYCFQMAKLSRKARIGVIIGLYVAMRLLRNVFVEDWAILGSLLLLLYMVFVLWSWVASGVGNLFLLLNRFARHALKKEEKLEAALVGGNVFAGIALCVPGIGFGFEPLFFLGPALIGAAFPFAIVFHNEHPLGKRLYAFLGALIMVLGVISVFSGAVTFSGFHPGVVAVFIAVGVTWMGAFRVLRR